MFERFHYFKFQIGSGNTMAKQLTDNPKFKGLNPGITSSGDRT